MEVGVPTPGSHCLGQSQRNMGHTEGRDKSKPEKLRESSASDPPPPVPSCTSSCFSSQLESPHFRESTLRSPFPPAPSTLGCPRSMSPNLLSPSPYPRAVPFRLPLSRFQCPLSGLPISGEGYQIQWLVLAPKASSPSLALLCLLPTLRDLFHCSPHISSIHSLRQAFSLF